MGEIAVVAVVVVASEGASELDGSASELSGKPWQEVQCRKCIQETGREKLSSPMVLRVKPGASKGFEKKQSDNPDAARGSWVVKPRRNSLSRCLVDSTTFLHFLPQQN